MKNIIYISIVLLLLIGITIIYLISNNFFENYSKFFLTDEGAKLVNNEKLELNEETNKSLEKEKKLNIIPTFDIVRVTKDGNAVIAGKAMPGSIVNIFDGEIKIGSVETDPQGEWVFVPSEPLSGGDRSLRLESKFGESSIIHSQENVVLSIPDKEIEPLVVLTNPSSKIPSKVLQNPDSIPITSKNEILIEVIDYDEKGNIILSGRTSANVEVRVYFNNLMVGSSFSDDLGLWVIIPDKKIDPGNYNLRAEKIDDFGKVIAYTETPFTKVDTFKLNIKKGKVIVQPGNSLWRIARANYGSGFSYTIIYKANIKKIKNPDLIYPGQVFDLPEKN